MRYSFFLLFLILCYGSTGSAQKKIRFPATDNLPVTANLYTGNPSNPYIILLHQENSSRGEFLEIAPRLVKMGFNCLAVDLRRGKEKNYVINETTLSADSLGLHPLLTDCLKDIHGAVHFVQNLSKKRVVLLGSSFSASLAMLAGKDNPDVTAVIAFSPGEFFLPHLSVRHSLAGFNKKIFIAGTKSEYPYLVSLSESVPDSLKRFFTPERQEGFHGASALLKSDPAFRQYWLALIMFIRTINLD